MKHIIVGKDKAFGDGVTATSYKKDVGDLNDGALSITRSDTGVLLAGTSVGSSFDHDTKLQIVQGTSGEPVFSPVINPFTLRWNKTTYDSAVAKVVSVGRNMATTGTWTLPNDPSEHVGEYVAIRVYDLSADPGVTNNVKLVSYLIKRGDTEANIHDNLFSKLEKLKGDFYANVEKEDDGSSNYGYKFTGIVGKNFRVIPELLISDSPITVETDFNIGHGLAANLASKEIDYSSRIGFNKTNILQNDLYTAERYIDANTDYDVFTLTWRDPNFQYLGVGTDPMVQTLLVAVPNGSDLSTHMSTVLGAIDDLIIPSGETGETGPTGPTGDTGTGA